MTNATGVKAVMPEHPVQNNNVAKDNNVQDGEVEVGEEIDSGSEVGLITVVIAMFLVIVVCC